METIAATRTLPIMPLRTDDPVTTTSSVRALDVKKQEKASDHLLMELIKDGDSKAFREIVTRYKDPITNYVYRIIHDYDTAVDISQEVFLRVYRKAGTYEPLAAFSTWVFRIATNLAINEVRRRKKAFTISIFSRLNDYENGGTELQIADTSAVDPEEELAQTQIRQSVREALNTLPIKYRVPLLLRELQGYSYEEIASIIAIPEGTVKSRINRGRSMLKKKLTVLMK